MRGLLSTLLVLPLLLIGCATEAGDDSVSEDEMITADVPAEFEVGAVLKTTSNLNLRSGPSQSAERVTTIPAGQDVTVVEAKTDAKFVHIAWNGKEGWAHGGWLKAASSSSSRPQTPTKSPGTQETPPPVTGEFSGPTHSNVTMLWQGNWDFLVRCDSFSKAQGRVVFFCDQSPTREFVDEGAWIAVPRNVFTQSQCGKSAKVCKGDRCIVAKIVEKSVTNGKWEGSTAVLNTLGTEVGFSSCTSSHGTATGVKVTMQ